MRCLTILVRLQHGYTEQQDTIALPTLVSARGRPRTMTWRSRNWLSLLSLLALAATLIALSAPFTAAAARTASQPSGAASSSLFSDFATPTDSGSATNSVTPSSVVPTSSDATSTTAVATTTSTTATATGTPTSVVATSTVGDPDVGGCDLHRGDLHVGGCDLHGGDLHVGVATSTVATSTAATETSNPSPSSTDSGALAFTGFSGGPWALGGALVLVAVGCSCWSPAGAPRPTRLRRRPQRFEPIS